ncbi:uncharacterized protein METZ01_LOCUS52479 [marine metagenome]|uniref:Uncharacterized protein n=1 Tax=marine metagenome TaxID=408172 RepID=A0A381S6B3_9ZZZZ
MKSKMPLVDQMAYTKNHFRHLIQKPDQYGVPGWNVL